MTSQSDTTMSPLLASPLFNRWVQSLFRNTEQREESFKARLCSEIRVDVIESHIHSGKLLLEEFAGARRAFCSLKNWLLSSGFCL